MKKMSPRELWTSIRDLSRKTHPKGHSIEKKAQAILDSLPPEPAKLQATAPSTPESLS